MCAAWCKLVCGAIQHRPIAPDSPQISARIQHPAHKFSAFSTDISRRRLSCGCRLIIFRPIPFWQTKPLIMLHWATVVDSHRADESMIMVSWNVNKIFSGRRLTETNKIKNNWKFRNNRELAYNWFWIRLLMYGCCESNRDDVGRLWRWCLRFDLSFKSILKSLDRIWNSPNSFKLIFII